MFFRLLFESILRQRRRKMLAGIAILLGTTAVTAMLALATTGAIAFSRVRLQGTPRRALAAALHYSRNIAVHLHRPMNTRSIKLGCACRVGNIRAYDKLTLLLRSIWRYE